VVQSSRVGEGRVVRNNSWYEAGMVVADNLSPQKAAILLSLALTKHRILTTFSACSTSIEALRFDALTV
jgi:L-asparaginase/Glu-tRNA(Gln) amidotransferase subunit D